MKKILTTLSVIALVFTSCSKDDSPSEESNSGFLLTKTVETYDDGSTYTTNFTYNGNKLIKIDDSDGESETFVYDSNGKLVSGVEKYYNSNTLITGSVSYIYNGQNKLSSIAFSDGLHLDYAYNINGTVTEDNYDSNGNARTSIYTFLNDNIVSVTESSTGLPTYVTTFQFDSKNNPFKNVYKPYELFNNYFDFDFNVNNVTSSVYDNDVNDYRSSTYTYLYNSNNYPTVRTETTGDGEVITTSYFYN